MSRILISTLCLLLFTQSALAATIRNQLNQRLSVKLNGGITLELPPSGTANVADKDLTSPHLQSLISRGEVAIIQDKPMDIQKKSFREKPDNIYPIGNRKH